MWMSTTGAVDEAMAGERSRKRRLDRARRGQLDRGSRGSGDHKVLLRKMPAAGLAQGDGVAANPAPSFVISDLEGLHLVG